MLYLEPHMEPSGMGLKSLRECLPDVLGGDVHPDLVLTRVFVLLSQNACPLFTVSQTPEGGLLWQLYRPKVL